jgi:hypothetical protein
MRFFFAPIALLTFAAGATRDSASCSQDQCPSPQAIEHDAQHRIQFYAQLVKLTSEGNYAAIREKCEQAFELCENKHFSFYDVCARRDRRVSD